MTTLEKVAVLAVGGLVVVVAVQFFMMERMAPQAAAPVQKTEQPNEKAVVAEKIAPVNNPAGEPTAVAARPDLPDVPAAAEPLLYVAPPTEEETRKYTETMTHPAE